MPRSPAGQLALLEQQDVGETAQRQVIGHAGADHAAADDHYLRPAGQRGCCVPRCPVCASVPRTTLRHEQSVSVILSFRAVSPWTVLLVSSLDVLQQLAKTWCRKAGQYAVVPFHRPGPEVEINGADGGLDRSP